MQIVYCLVDAAFVAGFWFGIPLFSMWCFEVACESRWKEEP